MPGICPLTGRKENVALFEASCSKAGFSKVAPYVFEKSGPFTRTVTLSTLIHGNEIGGIEVFLKLLSEIERNAIIPRSNLRLILGNVPAYIADKRFLESDLNRSFGLDQHRTSEELRAKELEPFLADTDVLIDIHQTIGPTSTAFFIFEYEAPSYSLARYLERDLPIVTYTAKRSFKGKTSTGFTMSKGGLAITIETGQKSVSETQISLGMDISRKAIETDFTLELPPAALSNTYTFSEVIENPDGSLEMERVFHNFEPIHKGDLLARNSERKIYCGNEGVILFPKYGEYAKKSAELALLLKPVKTESDF